VVWLGSVFNGVTSDSPRLAGGVTWAASRNDANILWVLYLIRWMFLSVRGYTSQAGPEGHLACVHKTSCRKKTRWLNWVSVKFAQIGRGSVHRKKWLHFGMEATERITLELRFRGRYKADPPPCDRGSGVLPYFFKLRCEMMTFESI